MAEMLNKSGSPNYIIGRDVYILGKFETGTCAELIGNMVNLVNSLPAHPVFTETELFRNTSKLTSPYDLSPEYPPVITIYISSTGGFNNVLYSICSVLEMAKAKGAIIRTHVVGQAASCASLLAVQGTPGFRIMGANAYHLIHHGHDTIESDRMGQLEVRAQKTNEMRKRLANIYKNNSKLTDAELKRYCSIEGAGELEPSKCLAKGLCDWVLTPQGIYVKNLNKTR